MATENETLFRLAFPGEKKPADDGRLAGGRCSTCDAVLFWTHNPITGVWTPLVKRPLDVPPQYLVVFREIPREMMPTQQAIDVPAMTLGQLLGATDYVMLKNGMRIPAELLARHNLVNHFTTCPSAAFHSRRS